jgi:hypothetical protein
VTPRRFDPLIHCRGEAPILLVPDEVNAVVLPRQRLDISPGIGRSLVVDENHLVARGGGVVEQALQAEPHDRGFGKERDHHTDVRPAGGTGQSFLRRRRG